MKAALIAEGVVQNIIVWDDTCEAPDGFNVVVIDDDVPVSIGWVQEGSGFVDPNPAVIPTDIPQPPVSDLRAQLAAIMARLSQLETKTV